MRPKFLTGRRLLGIPLGLVLLFLYGPIAMLMVLSFNESGLPTAWGGFSVKWYGELAANTAIRNAAVNSLLVAAGSTLLATPIGALLALGLERAIKSTLLDALVFVPIIIPDIVLAIALLLFYSFLQMTLGLHSILLSHVVFNIAFVAAIVRTRLSHFDPSLEEASLDLGASEVTTFFKITLPLIFPGIIAGALLAFTISVDEFVVAYFTAGPAEPTLPILIYSMVRFGVTPDVNALATLVVLVSITLLLTAQRFGAPLKAWNE